MRATLMRAASTAFVKKHLKTSRDRNAGAGLMIEKLGGDEKFYLASLDSLDEDSAAVVKICDPLKALLCAAEYVCACNGLMCVLKNMGRDVFVLNPVLRKFKKVTSAPPEFPSSSEWKDRFSFGFGYDEVLDELVTQQTAIKNEINSKNFILGFDLALQQFKEVPLPPMEDDSSKRILMDDVGENLCIIHYSSSCMDVWLMNYPGAESTWYKALSTEQEEMLRTGTSNELIAFSRSGKDLLLQVYNPLDTTLAWYNLNQETLTNVGIRGLPIHFCSFLYTESLLQLTEDEPL
ncbi:hypothetical protein AgCh_014787 [Apium graveolens]